MDKAKSSLPISILDDFVTDLIEADVKMISLFSKFKKNKY